MIEIAVATNCTHVLSELRFYVSVDRVAAELGPGRIEAPSLQREPPLKDAKLSPVLVAPVCHSRPKNSGLLSAGPVPT